MRFRRTLLAQAILAIGTTGAVVASPVLALTTAAAPPGIAAVAMSIQHGSVAAPDMIIQHA
jgi:hypothetical protein